MSQTRTAAPFVPRSPGAVTFAVWKALFLREALNRLSRERSAWFWLIVEPAFHIASLMVIFATFSVQMVNGMESVNWIMVGMLGFFVFRRPADQSINAISSNQQLFTYRQVKPLDTVLVRAALEGFLMILISVFLVGCTGLAGLIGVPADPLLLLLAIFGLWLYGLGFGLISSVLAELMPELGRAIQLFLTPLYLISGVMFPLTVIPALYRDWFLLNPIVHGIEAARQGFSPYYHAGAEVNLGYLYGLALISIFLGLVLHQRFATRLASQ